MCVSKSLKLYSKFFINENFKMLIMFKTCLVTILLDCQIGINASFNAREKICHHIIHLFSIDLPVSLLNHWIYFVNFFWIFPPLRWKLFIIHIIKRTLSCPRPLNKIPFQHHQNETSSMVFQATVHAPVSTQYFYHILQE